MSLPSHPDCRATDVFLKNEIDGSVLPDLTEGDFEKLGVPMGPQSDCSKAIANGDRTKLTPSETQAPSTSTDTAERRQLTVMFCDLVGSTAMSARLDPEDMRNIIAAYHRRCATLITGGGGFVAKYMGDGVLEPPRVCRRLRTLRRWSDGTRRRTRAFPEVRRALFGWFSILHEKDHPSRLATVTSIAAKIGCMAESLNEWVKKAEIDGGVPTEITERLKALERENRELRQANEILRKASAYFAQAELDRRFKP